jgi:hypothetical protein
MSVRGLLRYFWLWLRWQFGVKGKLCKCSFYEASHINNALEQVQDMFPQLSKTLVCAIICNYIESARQQPQVSVDWGNLECIIDNTLIKYGCEVFKAMSEAMEITEKCKAALTHQGVAQVSVEELVDIAQEAYNKEWNRAKLANLTIYAPAMVAAVCAVLAHQGVKEAGDEC